MPLCSNRGNSWERTATVLSSNGRLRSRPRGTWPVPFCRSRAVRVSAKSLAGLRDWQRSVGFRQTPIRWRLLSQLAFCLRCTEAGGRRHCTLGLRAWSTLLFSHCTASSSACAWCRAQAFRSIRAVKRGCRTLTTPGAGGGSGEGNPNLLATTPNDPRCAVEAAGYPGQRREVALTGSTEDSQNG